jgi:16S rRNA (uracil1498-N3)-methyltransferase
MQIFYAPGIEGRSHTLDETESRHCIKVLRMTRGTAVKVIDGKGNLFEGYISDPDIKRCVIAITSEIKDYEKREYYLHIAISPLKNPERFEWFIEKSVEIGIDEITPLICKHTEKQSIKQERTENIIISAMKQSLKARKPILNPPVLFDEFISREHSGKKMIAHCINELPRKNFSEAYSKGSNATIMIGPEGDFSADEISSAVQNGFVPFQMGTARLRTETAGIAACHSVYFMNSQG